MIKITKQQKVFKTTDYLDFTYFDTPLFHLVVVVDDHLEGITHIIRGEDHISNTPRQILIYEAFGWKIPEYAHLPLVLNNDRTKLSKRKGALSLLSYRDEGYLPETMLNAISFLGWSPSNSPKEIYTKNELIKDFDLIRVKKGGASLNEVKLKWFQKQHLINNHS